MYNFDIIKDLFLGIFILCICYFITKYKIVSFLVLLILLLSIYFILKYDKFGSRYFEKKILVILGMFGIIYALNYNNYYFNNYIVPIILYINILVLFKTCYPFKTIYDYISFLGILLLLITFNFSNWKVNNAKLVKVDYNWIYLKTIVLTILYLFSTCFEKGYVQLIPLYAPFLFPLNEYLIHRGLFLGLGILYFTCFDKELNGIYNIF